MLKHLCKEKRVNVNLKATKEEIKIIKEKADEFTKGNVSAWVRYASMNCKPPRAAIKE